MTDDSSHLTTDLNFASQSSVIATPKSNWNFSSHCEPRSTVSRWIAAIISLTITFAAHLLWLRLGGYVGYSLFTIVAALLLFIGILLTQNRNESRSQKRILWIAAPAGIVSLGLLLGWMRMVWQGNCVVAFSTMILLGMLSLSLHERPLSVIRSLVQWFVSIVDGVSGWLQAIKSFPIVSECLRRWPWVMWGIPSLLGFVFLLPLIFAHPELVKMVSNSFVRMYNNVCEWLYEFDTIELFTLFCVASISMGMLLPTYNIFFEKQSETTPKIVECSDTVFYVTRNSLIAVIFVFSVFLIYELGSFWSRSYPPGFDYSGFAHQGAAWLTLALAMATVTLSAMFTHRVRNHPRIKELKRLAKLWSACNFLLVVAVYYRLLIYVDFNGLTRLRIVGFTGVTCVLVGFIFVLYRVIHEKSWGWLIYRQAWSFLISIYFLAIIPMDWIAHTWNVRQIESGKLAPTIAIAVQSLSDEGYLCLLPLMRSSEPNLREGVAALLASRWLQIDRERKTNERESDVQNTFGSLRLRDFQGSTYVLMDRLDRMKVELQPFFESENRRQKALNELRKKSW